MALAKVDIYNIALTLLGDHRLATATDDVESRYALDASWDRAVAFVFQAAFWRFAIKTASLTHNGALTALPGYTSTFALPAGYYRPHAIFVLSGSRECPLEIRQQGVTLHANTTPIYLRYVDSTLIATLTNWPETVANALGAYLAFVTAARISQDPQAPDAMFAVWQQYFATAQAIEAIPDDPWLRHQLSGRLRPTVLSLLEDGYWRFAIKTVVLTATVDTPSDGYAYVFDRPADWLRTFHIYEDGDSTQSGFDFRDEGEQFHANYSPIALRYVSKTLGLDAAQWSGPFEEAVLARLALREAMEAPGTAGAVIAALAGVAERKEKQARSNDDTRERPLVNLPSRFVSGRYGGGWGRSFREQG